MARIGFGDSFSGLTDDELFEQAIEIQSHEGQIRFLQTNCAGDLEQQDRIHGLIESHLEIQSSKQGSILDRATEAFQVLDSHDARPGSMLGSFQLIELLGEGGMGLVYLAGQSTPIRRRVAIKIIKPGMDSRTLMLRFEAERQTLACLDHPSITHIIEAGLTDLGQPYFVMELAEGLPITQCCNQNRTSLRERIKLIVDVCDAIQHAHQRGIIHRDIKPNNLIATKIDEHYQVKVIDFGIAKAKSNPNAPNSNSTHYGEFLGTPLYMSPEQMLCDPSEVDIRTDVFSLGVVLYELLTGETPFGSARYPNKPMLEIAMNLRETDCIAPSMRVFEKGTPLPVCCPSGTSSPKELQAFLKGELDWILMKALTRDKQARYQSVLDFQRDLMRFLEGQPVEAAGERTFYRIRKFIHRHRALTSLGAVTASLCICFTITASWLSMMASRSEKSAKSRLQEVLKMQQDLKLERDRAELAAKRSRTLAQTFVLAEVIDRSAIAFFRENPDLFVEMEREKGEAPSPESAVEPSLTLTEDRALIIALNSNLISQDPRMVVQGKFDWLADILVDSDVNLKEIIRNQREAESRGLSNFANTPEPIEGTEAAYSPAFEFSQLSVLRFRELFLEEIETAFDDHSKFVADAFDSLGLAQADNQFHSKAQASFEHANRIRANDPDQYYAALQSKLFLANCLKKCGMKSESEVLFAEVASRLEQVEQSNETVDSLRDLNRTMMEN